MTAAIRVPKVETPEWRRSVAVQIVKEHGRDLSPERLADVGEMDAWEWCFQAFGPGVPVSLATVCEVVGVARIVGAQTTWGRDLAEKVGRLPSTAN